MQQDELTARRTATADNLDKISARVRSGECAALILTAVNIQEAPTELAFNAGGMAELGLLLGLSRLTHAKVEQGVLLHEAMRATAEVQKAQEAPDDVDIAAPSNPFSPKAN